MDINDIDPESVAFDDDLPIMRRDPRRLLACFLACVLAGSAAVLVTRSFSHKPPALEPRADEVSTTTTAVPERSGSDGRAGGLADPFDELFNGRIEELFGGAEGSGAEEPGSTPSTSPNTSGEELPAGWTTGQHSIGDRSFAIAVPPDWTIDEQAEGVTVGSPDGAAGVAVGVTFDVHGGFEAWMDQWVTQMKATKMPDLEVLERGPFRVEGREGYRLHHVGTYMGERMEGEIWLVADGRDVWVLSQAFPAGDVDLGATCQMIARSLRPAVRA